MVKMSHRRKNEVCVAELSPRQKGLKLGSFADSQGHFYCD